MVTRWSQTVFDGELLRRAGRVVDEASRLSMAGCRDEAAATGERGLRMVREVAGRAREQALPLLVQATCNQSWYLAETARYSAALEHAEEGLSVARNVGDIQLLARALLTSASRLLESGRPQEALTRSQELVELPHLRSDARLARDLSTLSMSLAATGQHAEALHFSERCWACGGRSRPSSRLWRLMPSSAGRCTTTPTVSTRWGAGRKPLVPPDRRVLRHRQTAVDQERGADTARGFLGPCHSGRMKTARHPALTMIADGWRRFRPE